MDNLLKYAILHAGDGSGGSGGGGGGGGGGSTADPDKAVRFIDYDGTVVSSYTAEEFALLSDLPANPTHEGLTAQGWNWTLSDAKNYVSAYGELDIGQMYNTDDGKTRMKIHLEAGRLSPTLRLSTLSGNVTVDWGDGSAAQSTRRTVTHTYSEPGDYVIAIDTSGVAGVGGTSGFAMIYPISKTSSTTSTDDSYDKVYKNAVTELHLGDMGKPVYATGFNNCTSLKSVTLPNSDKVGFGDITSRAGRSLSGCTSLRSVTIPPQLYSTEQYMVTFSDCTSLKYVSLPKGSPPASEISFYGCGALKRISIPDDRTHLRNGMLSNCGALDHAYIPNSITNIGDAVFKGCSGIAGITIPASVTAMSTNSFSNCYGLAYLKFEGSTPPTVNVVTEHGVAVTPWENLPTDCIIYVPAGSLSAYTSAENYPSSSTYTYTEY